MEVQPVNITLDVYCPKLETAIYYYAYWEAYKNYFGIIDLESSIKAITSLIHQSYDSYDTLDILYMIFGLDPSISFDDGDSGSWNHHNIIT